MSKPIKWIDVNIMPPNPPCLTFDAHGNIPKISHSTLCLFTDDGKPYYLCADLWDGDPDNLSSWAFYNNRITHWMPIPEPPGGWYDESTKESNVFHNNARYNK